jgi:hypothetical protein
MITISASATAVSDPLFLPLALTTVTIASVHAAAPDHWMPLAALARAQGWSAWHTARVTAACAFAHVTASVVLGGIGLAFGLQLFERFGAELESLAGALLIAFGLAYGVWGLRHAAAHLHGHSHAHYDHVHGERHVTPWTVILVFTADPCVAIFPLMFAASPLGWPAVLGIVVLYEAATIATMSGLVLPARTAARTLVRGAWMHRYGDAMAGAFIVVVGTGVAILGW